MTTAPDRARLRVMTYNVKGLQLSRPDVVDVVRAAAPDVQVLVVADHEGTAHPVVWVAPGPGRIVYDALGHDLRSYDSPTRVALFRGEVRWLLSR